MKAFLLLLLLLSPTLAIAAPCGPGTPKPVCACGDTVNGAYSMTTSLVCATGHGLRVASAANLHCAGFTIQGGNQPGTYGVYLDGVSNAVVRKCVVTGFDRGIRLNGAHFNSIKKSSSFANGDPTLHTGYGADLAGGSSWNAFNEVAIFGNADEGIHFGAGAHGNVLKNSEACGNFRENVYLLDNRDTEVTDNVIGHDCYGWVTTGNSVYAKHAIHAYFLRNTFHKNSVHITGNSVGTLFMQNTFNTTYKEDCYSDGTCPSGTLFVIPAP